MLYHRYLNISNNLVDYEKFREHTAVSTENCHCGSEFFPGIMPDNQMFKKEFIAWLGKYDCLLFRAEGFTVFPMTSLAWHNDTNDAGNDLEPHETTKINFMWGDLKNCFMEYGELFDDSGLTVVTNKRGRQANVYDPAKMIITESFSLEHPVLINRGPTHRVSNKSTQAWQCLSCIIYDVRNNRLLEFKDAVERFSECVVGYQSP